MKCSKCGTDTPSEARFCAGCGSPVSREGHSTGVPVDGSRKNTGLLAAIAGLFVVALIAVLLSMYLKGQRVADMGPVKAPEQPPVLSGPSAPANPQPGVLQAPQTEARQPEKKEIPPEIIAYLDHLKKVEAMRQNVYSKELQAVVASASDAMMKALPFDWDKEGEIKKPTDELAKKSMDFSREWQQVSAYFLQVKAPADCGMLASKYYESLSTFISFMGKFQDAINKNDIAGLNAIKADAGTLDQKFNEADSELGKVCDKFGLEKSFKIRGDAGQTPVFGF